MLPIHGYTDIMFICIVISLCIVLWLSSSPFKLNLTLIELEQICWLSHGATESSSPVQPHLPGWGGPNAVYCHASRRCLQLGKVMCVCYPDQVGDHKPCARVVLYPSVPVWDEFVLATTVAATKLADVMRWHQGDPGHSPKGSLLGVARRVSCNRLVLSKHHWSTRMGARGHEFHSVGTMY